MKKITFSALLSVLILALPNMGVSQTAPDDQFFLDWNARWRQAWLDADVEAIRSMLPDDFQMRLSSNQRGAFGSWNYTKEPYVDLAEEFFTKYKGKVREWSDLYPGSVTVARSSDGSTVWLTDICKVVELWEQGNLVLTDSVSQASYFTFQPRGGNWVPVALFDNYFRVNNFNSWAGIVQKVDASDWQGKKFRLEAAVRITSAEQAGSAAIWARIDKADGTMGFFDNMGERPIRSIEWATYTIEGTVDEGADTLNFGASQSVPSTGYFDDFKLSIETSSGQWEAVPLTNAGFENTEWQDGKPEGWRGNVFQFENFQVEQSAERPFVGKYALKVTGSK